MDRRSNASAFPGLMQPPACACEAPPLCSLCAGSPGEFYACAACRKKAAFAMTDGRVKAADAA